MTYRLSLLCQDGIVSLSGSRTSAGVDNITIQTKWSSGIVQLTEAMPKLRFPHAIGQPGEADL